MSGFDEDRDSQPQYRQGYIVRPGGMAPEAKSPREYLDECFAILGRIKSDQAGTEARRRQGPVHVEAPTYEATTAGTITAGDWVWMENSPDGWYRVAALDAEPSEGSIGVYWTGHDHEEGPYELDVDHRLFVTRGDF